MKRKKAGMCLILFLMALTLTGCISVSEKKEKGKELDFTVVKEADLPEEVKSQIEVHKKEAMKLTWSDQGYLYLIRGYGTQKTTGFSVVVDALYETEDEIVFRTTLKGPANQEEAKDYDTSPYVVVKLETTEKPCRFE